MKHLLIIGDFHIPTRARDIPPALKIEIEKQRYDFVLCTGDLVSERVLTWLNKLGDKIYVVRGNMDHIQLPEFLSVRIEDTHWGIFHGSGIYPRGDIEQLSAIAIEKGVDVLAHGHTHVLSVDEVIKKGRKLLLVNPGSVTGVWSGSGGSLIPSFIKAIVDGRTINLTCYELINNSVRTKNITISL